MTNGKTDMYLGDLLSTDRHGKHPPLRSSTSSLTTHCFITGKTGSGKTGTVFTLVEEAVKAGVPVVLFDIKSDLVNIAQTRNTTEGKALRERMAVRYLTPASFHGESVNLLHGLTDPEDVVSAVTALLKLCNIESKAVQTPEHNFLTQIIRTRHAQGLPVSLVDLIYAVQEPGFSMLGAMPLEAVFPPKKRMQLANALNTVLCDPDFEAWRVGIPLDFEKLLAPREDGRVPVIVYSLQHIIEDEKRNFALTIGLEALVKYMRRSSGTSELRTLAVIDEMMGLMPPAPKNASTKLPILALLKQARAFGIGMVLATQNPYDLDYKGLGNIGTWIIGTLKTARDKERIIEGLTSEGHYDRHQLSKLIGALEDRQFLFARSNLPLSYRTRDVHINLSGPVTSKTAIQKLYEQGRLEPVDRANVALSRLAEARSLFSYDESWEDRVRALEVELVQMGHTEVLEDSPLGGDLYLPDSATGHEGMIAKSAVAPPVLGPPQVKAGQPAQPPEQREKAAETEADEREKKLRKKFNAMESEELAKKAVRAKLFPNKTAAKATRKPGMVEALVRHELNKAAAAELVG